MTGIDPRLRTRIERLERFGLWMLFALAAVPMVIGGFLPWYTDTSGKDQTFRLFTQGFELFAGQPEDSADLAFGVVFAGCFLFLDLTTLAALMILMVIAGWRLATAEGQQRGGRAAPALPARRCRDHRSRERW